MITEVSESDAQTSYPVTRRIYEGRSGPCGSIVIADSPTYGRLLFLDGELQSAAADEHIYHETLVHPVMAAAAAAVSYHHDPSIRVLVVGGGEGATVREVLKWAPEHVDWIDIDGELVALCREHLGWAPGVYTDPRVRYQAADIRDALPALGQYDAIILDLPDPDGDTGYLYSEPFWRDLRDHMVPGGFIVTHCGPVRPFGSIGGGFQRILTAEAIRFRTGGFYSQSMPSFQGEWGFMLASTTDTDPFDFTTRLYGLPAGLVVADTAQIHSWANKPLIWQTATQAFTRYV
jgi:spermidine synthase